MNSVLTQSANCRDIGPPVGGENDSHAVCGYPRRGAHESNLIAQGTRASLHFGGQVVLEAIDFHLDRGQIVLLRGGNGAGKTSLLSLLSGYLRPTAGTICLDLGGRTVRAERSSPENLAAAGVGRLWQDIRLFGGLTVLENVMVATPGLRSRNPLWSVAARPWIRHEEEQARALALANLERVGLRDRAASSADKLSLGQMKRVALARLLQMNATLWLLDEPLAGLDHESVVWLGELLREIRTERRVTVLLVEHQHERVEEFCDSFWTLAEGKLQTELNGAVSP